jgi:hypothetical protein
MLTKKKFKIKNFGQIFTEGKKRKRKQKEKTEHLNISFFKWGYE